MNNIEKIIEGFSDVKVLVIGDLMLDEFVYGRVDRLSPEAPVPLLLKERTDAVPGGAANTAKNIASLGGRATLFGVIGTKYTKDGLTTDDAGKTMLELLQASNIDTDNIIRAEDYPTIVKRRYITQSQHLIRVDDEKIYSGHHPSLFDKLKELIPHNDIIIISDYAKGFMNQELSDEIKSLAQVYDKKILVDTKPVNSQYFKGVYLVKPNAKEAKDMTGLEVKDDDNALIAGRKLQEYFGSNILLTRGDRGMDLFESDRHMNIPTQAKLLRDVSGAGDTVIATVGLCLALNIPLQQSAIIANYAAGVVIGKIGTATTTQKELIEYIKNNR